MANINKLQMAKTICSDLRISIHKTFFGLSTRLTYNRTGSQVDAVQHGLTPAEGDHLSRILSQPHDTLLNQAATTRLHPVVNGNYQLDTCISRDHQFAAIQLLKYIQLNYEPVSDVLIFEGNEAEKIASML